MLIMTRKVEPSFPGEVQMEAVEKRLLGSIGPKGSPIVLRVPTPPLTARKSGFLWTRMLLAALSVCLISDKINLSGSFNTINN